VPAWPLPATSSSLAVPLSKAMEAARPPKYVAISSGACASSGLRLLDEIECSTLGALEGHSFIGRTVEPLEFPGCVRWGGGFVEFNAHEDQSVGCHVGGKAGTGKPPACLCGAQSGRG